MEKYIPKYSGKFIGKDGVMTCNEVCNILSEVISSPSENGNESPCGNTIIELCKREDLTYEVVPCTEDRFNVMITVGASSYEEKKHGLLIHGHYDTVLFMEMEEPLNAKIKDGMMWGRGSVDQKGGLVAGLCAAIVAKRSGFEMKKPLCIAAVIDEESEHRGSYKMAESKLRADFGISTEPTGTYTALFGCRGTTPVKVIVKGKTAHAGMPELGVNAIQQSIPILNELFKLELPTKDLGELGVLKSTNCVSMMEAGSGYNNVPGEAWIMMDRRTIPGETSESALAQINDAINKAKLVNPSIEAYAEIARPDWKWEPIKKRGLNPTLTPIDSKIFKVLSDSAKEAGLPEIKKGIFHGYCDMDFMVNDLDIPTLVYGPGDANLCHNPNEEVSIDEVCMVTEVFCNMITKLCC